MIIGNGADAAVNTVWWVAVEKGILSALAIALVIFICYAVWKMGWAHVENQKESSGRIATAVESIDKVNQKTGVVMEQHAVGVEALAAINSEVKDDVQRLKGSAELALRAMKEEDVSTRHRLIDEAQFNLRANK